MNKSIEEIFNSIKNNEGRLPKEELKELISREDEAKAFLIDYMTDFKINYKNALEDMSYFGHIYATYLLAQFKEKSFYDIYLDILELPNNSAMALYDDGIKEHGGRIIASVYNEDNTRLIEIIQSDNIAKEIKCAVKEAFEIIESENPKLINSIFEEVSKWECFKEEDTTLNNLLTNDLIVDELRQGMNDFIMKNSVPLKLGRNDLCSCGSNKKYKRCCGKYKQ